MKGRTNQTVAYMQEALVLAAKGRGAVEPNPMVGCVLVKAGRVVGRGYHQEFGKCHAEVKAIRNAKAAAKGATLYVTLEPCTHQGKTPPCTDAIVRAGIKKVVWAMTDPHKVTRGKAKRILTRAGIQTDSGLCSAEARALNAPYIKLITTGMPYVTAKWAMTLDGKIASSLGDSKWITTSRSRRVAHRMRSESDAVLVGLWTVKADDPLLTCRIPGGTHPLRVVADTRAQLPLTSRLVHTAGRAETVVLTSSAAPAARLRALERAGCRILTVRRAKRGVDLVSAMEKLGRLQVTNLLIEGGGALLGSAFDARIVDRVAVFIAPKILGGKQARSPHEGQGIEQIRNALTLRTMRVTPLDPDLLIEGEVEGSR